MPHKSCYRKQGRRDDLPAGRQARLTVHEYAAALRPRYRTAKKGVKKRILDEFCQTTGMHRKAAIRLLGKPARPQPLRCGRPQRYGPEVTEALVKLWEVGDRMCGNLLAAVMPDLLGALERHGELRVSPEVRELLLTISPSTIDRLLRRQRLGRLRQPQHPGPATTTLKSQIPIRTWSEWQDVDPGSLQADLVLHCGESTEGFLLTTLCAVDVATAWTELRPVWGMGQQLYSLLGLLFNFFRPVRKLVGKKRLGAKLVRRYDEPQTPYQRLLAAGALSEPARAALEKQFLALNPAQLQRRTDQLLRWLWETAERPTPRGVMSVG